MARTSLATSTRNSVRAGERRPEHDLARLERVAEALGLSTETIRTHTKRILAKLNANTRTHAVAIAVRAQILD